MSENNDENPEPWKDLPEIYSQNDLPYKWLGVPYEKFRKDVEPLVLESEFWNFCSSIDVYDEFLITGGNDLIALRRSKEVIESKSFVRERMKAVEPSGNPFWIFSNDIQDHSIKRLYRFLDGGYALVGDESLIKANLRIVPLSELTDHKLYMSTTSAGDEKLIESMNKRVEQFKDFSADRSSEMLSRTSETVSEEEMDRIIQRLYKSDQAAAIHRAALYFQHRERKKEDPPDLEEAPE